MTYTEHSVEQIKKTFVSERLLPTFQLHRKTQKNPLHVLYHVGKGKGHELAALAPTHDTY